MIKKSTLLHLRFPFSFFLLPVFLFSGAMVKEVNEWHAWLVFAILHLMVYPASNGYNSYFDKDESSIGGLKNPPQVSINLYYTALGIDVIALLLSMLISIEFTLMIFIYGLVSKAYSHPWVRLKKYPILGWLTAGIFQGYYTYLLSYIAMADLPITEVFTEKIQIPGILASLLLLGSYPMTQVYQHDEDGKRGDMTLSRLLGIKNTFHFTAVLFTISTAGFIHYFTEYIKTEVAIVFVVCMSPVLLYFGNWYLQVRKHEEAANYERTMRLNFISSFLLNGFFIYLWLS